MEEKKTKQNPNVLKEIMSWILVVLCGFLLALFVTKVVIVKAIVPTGSMMNTIKINDKIIGNRLAYLFSDPKFGDIIIFKAPDHPSEDYVKRVIGLPGDTVVIKDGHVYINDVLLKEDYIREPMRKEKEQTYVVPKDSYFVMGDNRNSSTDSRYWETTHFVKKDAIRGKVWLRYSPSFGIIK